MCPGVAAGSPGACWAGRWPGPGPETSLLGAVPAFPPALLFCSPSFRWLGAAPLPWGITWLYPWGSHPTPSSQRRPQTQLDQPWGKKQRDTWDRGGAQHHPGTLRPPRPADTSPCAHLAGDVTWRLGRGENLLPAPVQRRGLSLRDVHSHRGHRFPGETTTAASPSPLPTCTSARTGCWEGGTGGFQPLHPKYSPNQLQALAETLPPLPGRAVTEGRARWDCQLLPLNQQKASVWPIPAGCVGSGCAVGSWHSPPARLRPTARGANAGCCNFVLWKGLKWAVEELLRSPDPI